LNKWKNIHHGHRKKGFYATIAGTILIALCCFTPTLVITLGAVGFSTFTPYLDYVLLPAFVMIVVLAFVSYGKWKKACKNCAINSVD
jgi:mercuric ion transport protein